MEYRVECVDFDFFEKIENADLGIAASFKSTTHINGSLHFLSYFYRILLRSWQKMLLSIKNAELYADFKSGVKVEKIKNAFPKKL